MAFRTPAPYDSVPYEGSSFFYTHPEALAVAGTLRGMTVPAIDTCRVLEIGCAVGGNLLPMAFTLPSARFVGIDLSDRQIEEGRARVASLGLSNVELLKKDVEDVDESLGLFDFIVCHGVYSWVPDRVRDAVLRVFERNLTPSGLAYLSFNVYPGWFLKSLVRKMIFFQFRDVPDLQSHVPEVRAYLQVLVSLFESMVTPHTALVLPIIKDLLDSPDHYIAHEYLEDDNEPYYFHEVVERAAQHGLQYIADQKIPPLKTMVPQNVWESLVAFSRGPVELEQFGDFLLNGTFRRAVFCRAGQQLEAVPSAKEVRNFLVIAQAKPVTAPESSSDGIRPESFEIMTKDGRKMTTNNPWLLFSLTVAYRFGPKAVSFSDVVRGVTGDFGASLPPGDPEEQIADVLLQCYRARLVSFHLRQPGCVTQAGLRPIASPLARFQASRLATITNLLHESIRLHEIDRFFIPRLDGTRTREDLVAETERAMREGEVEISTSDPERDLPVLVDQELRRLASALILQG